MIPLEKCRHGWTYEIHSRNLIVGVFNAEKKGFVGIREKFGSRYLFTEFHYDTGAPYGTVHPEKEIEECPVKDLQDSLHTICSNCKAKVEWRQTDPVKHVGEWFHLEPPTTCSQPMNLDKHRPYGPVNHDLFSYLDPLTKPVLERMRREWEEIRKNKK